MQNEKCKIKNIIELTQLVIQIHNIKMKVYYFYILANKKNGTLYIGVTNNLLKRVFEHKNKIIKGFTAKYNIDKLVYCEVYNDIYQAIVREKRVKKWRRIWKIALIEEKNQEWKDLYTDFE